MIKRFLTAIIVVLVFLTSCEDVELAPDSNINVKRVNLSNHSELSTIYKGLNRRSKFGRSIEENVETESIIEVSNDEEAYYSFFIRDDKPYALSNLIIRTDGEDSESYIQEYLPSYEWLNSDQDWLKFSGVINMYDLNFNLLMSANLSNGQSTGSRYKNPEGTSNGKIVHRDGKCYKPVLKQVHADLSASFEWVEVECPDAGGGDSDSGSGGIDYNGGSSGNPGDYGDGAGLDVDDSPGGGINTGGGSGGSVPGFEDLPKTREEREAYLESLLEEDPFLLIDIDCDQIQKWKSLGQFVPPNQVISKLEKLNSQIYGEFNIQSVQDASGTVVNMDYFPVKINKLPKNPQTNNVFTPNEFLNYIRTNFNNFINTNYSEFSPSGITGEDEEEIWGSDNALGAIMHINIPGGPGDGSVICSKHTSQNWIFSTIQVPYDVFQEYDGQHPVSGNRQFGIRQNSDGSYTFYTRGVDRITNVLDAFVAENIVKDPFENPDALWKSLRQKVNRFVSDNGGESTYGSISINRPNWDDIKDVIEGTKPISSIGCK